MAQEAARQLESDRGIRDGEDGEVFMPPSDREYADPFADLNPDDFADEVTVIDTTRAEVGQEAIGTVQTTEERLQLLRQLVFPVRMYLAHHRGDIVRTLAATIVTYPTDAVVRKAEGGQIVGNPQIEDFRNAPTKLQHGRLFIEDRLMAIEMALTKLDEVLISSPTYFNRRIYDVFTEIKELTLKLLMRLGEDADYNQSRLDQDAPTFTQEDALVMELKTLSRAMEAFRRVEMAQPERQAASNELAGFIVLLRAADAVLVDVQFILDTASSTKRHLNEEGRKKIIAMIKDAIRTLEEALLKKYDVAAMQHLSPVALEKLMRVLRELHGFTAAEILPLPMLATKIKETRGAFDAVGMDYREIVGNGYLPRPDGRDAEVALMEQEVVIPAVFGGNTNTGSGSEEAL